MTATLTKVRTHERQQTLQVADSKNATTRGTVTSGPHGELLHLQQIAGNRAVSNHLSTRNLAGAGRRVIQRKCTKCGTGAGKCDQCDEEKTMQRQPADQASGQVTPTASVVHEGRHSSAHSLDLNTRRSMESHFGQTFDHVRVHNDASAANSARQVDALAYTVGNDIVFGANQYKPDTDEGRRLLAHELTHTIQQGNGVAFDKIGMTEDGDPLEQEAEAVARGVVSATSVSPQLTGGVQIARQQTQPTSVSAQQPASSPRSTPKPAAPQGFTSCKDFKRQSAELAAAVDWVDQAIRNLEAKEIPSRTTGALNRYLTTDADKVRSVILPKLKLILTDLQLGATNFRCHTEQQCKAVHPGGAVAYAGNPITLCPPYFDESPMDRTTTLVHESGHNAGLGGNVVEWQWPFAGLSETKRLSNTESYAAFVRSNKYPSLAIFEHDIGVSLGVGRRFPSGASPRYVVKAELDFLLKKRVFHFLDLHTGFGLDIDTEGSVMGSAYFGARSFAPLSVTGAPLFLDLRAGGVFGGLLGAQSQFKSNALGFNVGGVSTEVGLGVTSGRFGASVGYKHIFNFLKSNPDIDELYVSGEIRF